MSLKIHIVDTADKPLESSDYMIAKLASVWANSGHIISNGPIQTINSDVAILHIDRTIVPQELIPQNPFNKLFLNKTVKDISKRSFSSLRLQQDDKWDGPVIIKSNFNCFGKQERKDQKQTLRDKIRRKIAKIISWKMAQMLPPYEYPVLNSLNNVPRWVWSSSDLIVERFMAERDGDHYCVRGWIFFGDRGYTYRLFSRNPVVKAGNLEKYEFLGEPPVDLVKFRHSNNFDFGKFDFVQVDGRSILLDINKTPTLNAGKNSPRVRELAEGLYDFLERQ